MADRATLSVVVPTLNEERHVAGCLGSLRAMRRPAELDAIELIVVDNGSTDRTRELARAGGARVIEVPPSTVARSRNAGAAAAAGEWLLFVDADCELPEDWLTCAFQHLASPAVVAFGATLEPPAASATWVERDWYLLGHPKGSSASWRVDWLATSNLLVRRAAFAAVGGFAAELVTCEDADLGYRLRRQGELVLDDRCRVRHRRESRTVRELFRREAWRGRGNLRGLRRHGLVLSELPSLLLPASFLGAVLTALAGGLLGRPGLATIGALAAAALPALLVVRRRIPLLAPRRVPSCWLLAATYLLARGLALGLPFGR